MLTEAKDTPDGKKAYYLTDIDMMPIVLANEAQEGADPKNLMPYGRKLYDVTDGGSRLIHDGGLKEFEKIQVKGIIWNDTASAKRKWIQMIRTIWRSRAFQA